MPTILPENCSPTAEPGRCPAPDCDRVSRTSKQPLCDMHYQRLMRHGDLNLHYNHPTHAGMSLEERFWARVNKAGPNGCWVWTGEIKPSGYGAFREYDGDRCIKHYAHRFSMRLAGTLVEDLLALHSCDNRPCVNPSHLRPGTQLDNIQDAIGRGRMNLDGLAIGQALSTRELRRQKRERLIAEEVA